MKILGQQRDDRSPDDTGVSRNDQKLRPEERYPVSLKQTAQYSAQEIRNINKQTDVIYHGR